MDDYQSFTYVDDFEIASTGNVNYDAIGINLLPGENFSSFDSLNYGCRLGLTNYRIIIIFDIIKDNISASDIISIPFGLIYHLEQHGFVCLNIITKIGRKFSVTFPNIELCDNIIEKIKIARGLKPFGVAFFNALQLEIPTHFLLNDNETDFEKKLIEDEFKRLKFDSEKWKITDVNKDNKLCTTYPQYHIVPVTITDELINNMAKFRSKHRFISVSYRSIEDDTVMLRSGQPLTGMSCWRNNADEEYLRSINDMHPPNQNESNITIFDARSYTNAQLNRVKGGGMEFEGNYQNSNIQFLSIPNMHSVRSAFESLSKALLDHDSDNFYDMVQRSNWLQLIRQLLKSATNISDHMRIKKKSVLIHCSDGWDRTPQLTSLAQIIMDPYYRTIDGFRILIYREWILYGHKFDERCALWPVDCSRQYSPVFIQFLDCVYQLLHQFPDCFQFNETFLIKLAIHVYSGLFGAFNVSLSSGINKSCSIWNYLCEKDIRSFRNPLYSPKTTFKAIRPKIQMLNIKLWTKLYFDSLNPNYYDIQHEDKYHSELPSEISNASMNSSLIVDENEMDDYYGEDLKFQPSLLLTINDDCEDNNGTKNDKSSSNCANYFNSVLMKASLESKEEPTIKDTKVHLELDLDGLFKQKDFISKYSESNRFCRQLYRSKIEDFKKVLGNLQLEFQYNFSATQNNEVENEDIEIVDNDIEDVVSCSDSTFSTLNDVVCWIPDHAVTNCDACKTLFSMFVRKHHCRNCGKIFCNHCSQHRSIIPRQKINWEVRVCDNCFNGLVQIVSEYSKSTFYKMIDIMSRLI